MPAIVVLAEFVTCGLLISAIAWVRHFRGAPRMLHAFGVRYIVPVLIPILVALLISLSLDEQRKGEFHPESSSPVVGMAIALGVGVVALVVWLVVEVRRFGGRPYGASRDKRPRRHK